MTHTPYSLYRKFASLTLVGLIALFAIYAQGAPSTEGELKILGTLEPNSLKLRQSLPKLKESAKGKNTEARLLYAKALISLKEYDDSLEVLKTINSDKEPRALLIMARAYDKKKEHTEEVRVLELLRKAYPFSEFVLTNLATAYLKNKVPAKSIEVLKELIHKQPKRKLAYFQLFDVYESAKNAYEIRNLLADMKERFSKDPEVMTRHCQYYASGGFLDAADESCAEAISLDPRIPENHVYLGITKKNLKELDQSEKIIKKAAQQFKKSELAQFTAGQLSDESKNWEISVRYYKTCISYHPESNRCQLGLAKSAYEIKLYDVALQAFSISCHNDPQARIEFRNAITALRNKNKSDVADAYNKKYERCGLKD